MFLWLGLTWYERDVVWLSCIAGEEWKLPQLLYADHAILLAEPEETDRNVGCFDNVYSTCGGYWK